MSPPELATETAADHDRDADPATGLDPDCEVAARLEAPDRDGVAGLVGIGSLF